MKTAAWITLLLAAVLLGGCDAGSGTREEGTTGLIDPYPPGAASPFFFRSASDWQQYAGHKSAQVRQQD